MDPSFTADLTLDEFRLVRELNSDLELPLALAVGGFSDDAGKSAERRHLARASLVQSKLVGSDDEATHPLLVLALSMPMGPQHAIQVQSWTPTTSSQTVITVIANLMSSVTVTLERSKDAATTDPFTAVSGAVRVVLGDLGLIVQSIQDLLAGSAPAPDRVVPMTVEVGLVESRSLIDGIRTGDAAVVDKLASLFSAHEAVPLLRSLAATMESGARIRASDPAGPRYSADWVQASTGEWVGFRLLGNPEMDSDPSAQAIVDGARVELTRRRVPTFIADILSLASSYRLEGADAQ